MNLYTYTKSSFFRDEKHLAKDRDQWQALVKIVVNFRVTYKAGTFLTSWVTISFSRRTVLHGVSS